MRDWIFKLFRPKAHQHSWVSQPKEYLQVCRDCGVTRWVLTQEEYDGYSAQEDTD